MADDALKQRLINDIEMKVKEEGECDHVTVFKQVFAEREADKSIEFEPTTLERYPDIYMRSRNLVTELGQILESTEQKLERQIKGDEKILLVAHSRTIRAFASKGVNPDREDRFLGSFYSQNTSATPFICEVKQEGTKTEYIFKHNR